MSDTTIIEEKNGSEEVSVDDLRRMLDESRNRETAATRERDDERAARLLAEQERDTNAGRVASEAEQRWSAQKQAVQGSLSAAEAEAEKAEREYAAAAESGDWLAAARAQRAIAKAEAQSDRLRGQQEFLESNRERLTKPAVQTAPREQSGDRYATLVKDLRPGEREWLDQRPQFISDEKYRARVFGASQIADGEGHARGTPQYFSRIEQLLGESRQEQDRGEERQERHDPPARRQSSDLPPQRRAVPNAAPAGSREIKLSADMVEVADSLYGNPADTANFIADPGERYQKYYTNMQRLKSQGRMQ